MYIACPRCHRDQDAANADRATSRVNGVDQETYLLVCPCSPGKLIQTTWTGVHRVVDLIPPGPGRLNAK